MTRKPLVYLAREPVFAGDIVFNDVTGLRIVVRSAVPDYTIADGTKYGPWTFIGEIDQGQGHPPGTEGSVFGPYAKALRGTQLTLEGIA